MKTQDWLSVFARYGSTDYDRHDTRAEAESALRAGEDDGEIYGLAVYRSSTGELFIHDPMGSTDEGKLREKINSMLARDAGSSAEST